MTPRQCQEGRGVVGLSRRALAQHAGVMSRAVARFEDGGILPVVVRDRLRLALEAAGVEFTNGDAPGVRLKAGTGQREHSTD